MTKYDTDFARWALETADALRERRIPDIDIDAVAEEIESLGKSSGRELESRVGQILEYLLKLDLVHGIALDYNRRGGETSIGGQRNSLASLLKQSPSLRNALTHELITQLYPSVARIVAIEFDVTPPETCPYNVHSIYPG